MMFGILRNALSGPKEYTLTKKNKEDFRALDWESNNSSQQREHSGYWENDNNRIRNKAQDDVYPQPVIMDDEKIMWDATNLITGPAWERGRNNEKIISGSACSNRNELVGEELGGDDSSKDFSHNNQQPFFKGNPYYVTERAIDDGIDHYERNDIRQRPSMLTRDYAIIGHNRETNLNRRMQNMNSDILASFVPARFNHGEQSIMPLDQIRDHTNNGKLYLPGDAPTEENPLGVTYRPEAKTYEELFNKTTVDAPGRFNAPLIGEKIFYHDRIQNLKRKDVAALAQWEHTGYMTSDISKNEIRASQRLKDELKVLPDFDYFGNVTGNGSNNHNGRVESFTQPPIANRGNGKDTSGTIIGAIGDKLKGFINSEKSQEKTKKKNTETYNGQDAALNKGGDKNEHFNYTTWSAIEKNPEKRFAVWNSRIEGYQDTAATGNRLTVSKKDIKRNKKENAVVDSRDHVNVDKGYTKGAIGQNVSHNKKETMRKESLSKRSAVHNMQANSKSIIRNDQGIMSSIKETFSNMYSTAAARIGNAVGIQGENNTKGTMSELKLRKKNYEEQIARDGNVSGTINHHVDAKTSEAKTKKKYIEVNTRGNAPVDRLAGNGYLLVHPEARESLRTNIVNNYFGNGYKDFGIVTHKGVNSIDWHKDRSRKVNTTGAARANAPQKQDLGLGSDQIQIEDYQRAKRVIEQQVINPGTRSHHAPAYATEGLVNRSGTQQARKVERAVNDGEQREFSFIEPRFDSMGRDKAKQKNKAARRASRLASSILPA